MADVRLIDANALRKGLREAAMESDVSLRDVLTTIDLFPTIDAVPVVRCRECKHHRNGACPMRSFHVAAYGYAIKDNTTDDGFCHMGAKMDGGAEL